MPDGEGAAYMVGSASSNAASIDDAKCVADSLARRLSDTPIDGAINELSLHLRERPEDIGAWANLGQKLLDAKRPAEAAECYFQILRNSPDDVCAAAMLGIALAQSGNHSEAERHLRRAIELDKSRAPTHYNLGVLLAEQNRFAEAQASLLEAIRIMPAYFEAHKSLGRVLTSLGRR